MPDTPTTDSIVAALEAREAALLAERERIDRELNVARGMLAAARKQGCLTGDRQPVNIDDMMTPAQRRRISKGARSRSGANAATEAFQNAISIPHAGGPGYSMRSLAEVLGVSHEYLSSVLNGKFRISAELDDRIHKLTGYRFPAAMVRPKKQ